METRCNRYAVTWGFFQSTINGTWLAGNLLCLPIARLLAFQFDDLHPGVCSLCIAAYQLAQAAQREHQVFPQRQRNRHLSRLRFRPLWPWQEDERTQSSVMRWMQER